MTLPSKDSPHLGLLPGYRLKAGVWSSSNMMGGELKENSVTEESRGRGAGLCV